MLPRFPSRLTRPRRPAIGAHSTGRLRIDRELGEGLTGVGRTLQLMQHIIYRFVHGVHSAIR